MNVHYQTHPHSWLCVAFAARNDEAFYMTNETTGAHSSLHLDSALLYKEIRCNSPINKLGFKVCC